MTVNISFKIDLDTLSEFNEKLKLTGKNADEVIIELIKNYSKNDIEKNFSNTEYLKLIETLFEKFKNVNVGQLANIVLRKILEEGAAEDYEIAEMQKSSNVKYIKRYVLEFGTYGKEKFNITYPVLLSENKIHLDTTFRFYREPLKIGEKVFYICSQWHLNRNKIPLENWIREHLLNWFEKVFNQKKSAMKDWILSADTRH